MLELAQIDAYYGASHVLREIDLSVQSGEIVSILGRNGVGKTTLLKSILGLEVRTRGTIALDGKTSPAARLICAPAPASVTCPRDGSSFLIFRFATIF